MFFEIILYFFSFSIMLIGFKKLFKLIRIRNFNEIDAQISFNIEEKKEHQVYIVADVLYPEIKYTYSLDGNFFSGNSNFIKKYFKFYELYEIKEFEREVLARSTVFYNPKCYSESSVVRPSIKMIVNQSGMFLAGAFVLGLLVLFF